MANQDQEAYANLEQQFGPLYERSDYKRGERLKWRSFDGTIKEGTILWVQEPGIAVGRQKQHILRAQYVVEPDNPAGTMGFELVPLGDVQE